MRVERKKARIERKGVRCRLPVARVERQWVEKILL